MADLTPEDIDALKLAKAGIECEHGTEAGKRYERLGELGYVKESTLTANGVAWHLTTRGAEIAYQDDDA